MKILILSLLRLGDILLHREVARAAKRQYPGCQIHFVIFSQFQSVTELMPEVDHWHVIDRQFLQRILVERRQSPLVAHAQLQAVVDQLNELDFDLILNATHNRFSVRLMDLLQAREKRGVSLDNGRKTPEANRWQTYLNENFSETRGSRFHYLEVLLRSLGLDCQLPGPAQDRRPGVILFQLLTSDAKKSWGLERFRELKQKLETEFPEHRVLGLCSPHEKDEVSRFFEWHEFLTPDLIEVRALLGEVRLLITGDTSIQHLAAQQACPVLSLFLGSADPIKTAPWQTGTWVIQGQAECAPCPHSAPCSQKEHLCARSISVNVVFELASALLRRQPQPLAKSRKAFVTGSVQRSFALKSTPTDLEREMEQAVWSAYLNGSSVDFATDAERAALVALRDRHDRFRQVVSLMMENKLELEAVERSFPLWKDSLIRYRRDAGAAREVQALMDIRSDLLNRLCQQKEISHVRNSKPLAQEHCVET